MPEFVGTILAWLVPAVVVFGVTAIAIAVIAWGVRRERRSPRARAAAPAASGGGVGTVFPSSTRHRRKQPRLAGVAAQ